MKAIQQPHVDGKRLGRPLWSRGQINPGAENRSRPRFLHGDTSRLRRPTADAVGPRKLVFANQSTSGQHRIRTCDLYGVNALRIASLSAFPLGKHEQNHALAGAKRARRASGQRFKPGNREEIVGSTGATLPTNRRHLSRPRRLALAALLAGPPLPRRRRCLVGP